MKTWKDMFKIVDKEYSGYGLFLVDAKPGELSQWVGTYKSYKYAKNQAKRKYKMAQRNIEKILLKA